MNLIKGPKENNQSLVFRLHQLQSEVMLLRSHIQHKNKNEGKKIIEMKNEITELKHHCKILFQSNQKLQAMYFHLITLFKVQYPLNIVHSNSRFNYQNFLQKLLQLKNSLTEQKEKVVSQNSLVKNEYTVENVLNSQDKTVDNNSCHDGFGLGSSKHFTRKNMICNGNNTFIYQNKNERPINIGDIVSSESIKSQSFKKSAKKFKNSINSCAIQKQITDYNSFSKRNADIVQKAEEIEMRSLNKMRSMKNQNYWNEKHLFSNTSTFTHIVKRKGHLNEVCKTKSKRKFILHCT